MSSIAVTTCSRCGRRYQQSLVNGNVFKYPDGWKHYDLNDVGPDPVNIFDLCPFCYSIFDKEQEARLRQFVTEHVAPQFQADDPASDLAEQNLEPSKNPANPPSSLPPKGKKG